MNIRQLEAFHAVMNTGSATRAAEKLHVTQPAISKLLKALAEECGFQLFQRRGGQLMPTREARLLEPEVSKLFNGTQNVITYAQAIRANEVGQVQVAAPPALAMRYLPQILCKNLITLPDLQLQILSRTSTQIVDLVASGQADIGLSVLGVDHPDVHAEKILTFPMVCLLPGDHPLRKKGKLTVEDLRGQPFISLPSSDCTFSNAQRSFEIRGVSVTRRIEVPHSETAAMLVAQNVGVAVVTPFVGLGYSDEVVTRRLLHPIEHASLWLLQPKQNVHSIAASLLRTFIINALKESMADLMSEIMPHDESALENGFVETV